MYDVSIASLYHTTRVQSLASTLLTRHQDEVVHWSPVFSNFYPIVMTHTGICTKPVFDFLSACGVDVIALKRSIAFGHLRSRTRAYRAIYDAVKIPRTDEDYCLSPPPRSSGRTAYARTQVTFGSTTPAPSLLDRPIDAG